MIHVEEKGWRDVQKAENDVAKIKVWLLPCVVSAGVKAWVSPINCEGRLERCCLYAINYRWLYLLWASWSVVMCVRQRGLGVFVSTPRFEHTCNFLSACLHYKDLNTPLLTLFPGVLMRTL